MIEEKFVIDGFVPVGTGNIFTRTYIRSKRVFPFKVRAGLRRYLWVRDYLSCLIMSLSFKFPNVTRA